MAPAASKRRFVETWQRIGGSDGRAEYEELSERYGEAHRHHHTLEHIAHLFRTIDSLPHAERSRSPAFDLAVWYHDAVYDTHAKDNEEASAELASERMRAGGISDAAAKETAKLILATRHLEAAPHGPAALLVDLDLAILGADTDAFDRYEQQIRAEYEWASDEAYRSGRIEVLQGFLDRRSIYTTPTLRERLEESARSNLRRSIATLTRLRSA